MRRRDNTFFYNLSVDIPQQHINDFYEDIDNLEDIAILINREYFSGLKVVSRAMVSNWIYYPHKQRKNYANCFIIQRREIEKV